MAAQGMSTLGYPDDVIELSRQVLNTHPEPGLGMFAHLIIARALNEREDWDRATQELDVVERLLDVNDNPVHRTIYLSERGRVESGRGNTEAAVRFFLAASKLTPSDVVWYNLSIQYERLGRQDSRIDALQKAVNISKDIRYVSPLVGALLQEGRFSEAVEYGELGVRFHPGDSYAHAIRAYALGFFVQANRDQSASILPKLRNDIEIAFRGKSSGYPPAEMLRDLEGIGLLLLSRWVPFGPGASPTS